MFFKIGILKNLADFKWKTPVLEFLCNKVAGKKLTPTQVFSYDICKLLKNTFFYRALPVVDSENNEQQQLSEGFANRCYKIV